MFVFVPQAVYAFAQSVEAKVAAEPGPDRADPFPLLRGTAAEDRIGGVADWARQYNVKGNDTHWNNLIEFVEIFDPEHTAILAVPEMAGSFRHLTYYLPDYRIYGLGRDRDDSFGHLFTAYEGTSDYAVERLKEGSQQKLQLPANVRLLVIPDKDIYQRMRGVPLHVLELESDAEVAVVLVPESTALGFEDGEEKGSAEIVVELGLSQGSTSR
jgi:hypothetical protein